MTELVSPQGAEKVGWGDLSFEDLVRVSEDLGPRLFLAIAEAPKGSGTTADIVWGCSHRPEAGPDPGLDLLCDEALFAVLPEAGPAIVGHTFRTGELVELSGPLRLRAIEPDDLFAVASALAGSRQPPEMSHPSVTDVAAAWNATHVLGLP